MSEFINMGGYGYHVWSAYGLSVVVLLLNAVAARKRNLRARREVMDYMDSEQ